MRCCEVCCTALCCTTNWVKFASASDCSILNSVPIKTRIYAIWKISHEEINCCVCYVLRRLRYSLGVIGKCTGWAKKVTPFWYLSFLSCWMHFENFVYSRIVFIEWRHSSSGDVNKFCFMRINGCNFVTMVAVCSTICVCMEKDCRGSENKLLNCFQLNEHIYAANN